MLMPEENHTVLYEKRKLEIQRALGSAGRRRYRFRQSTRESQASRVEKRIFAFLYCDACQVRTYSVRHDSAIECAMHSKPERQSREPPSLLSSLTVARSL